MFNFTIVFSAKTTTIIFTPAIQIANIIPRAPLIFVAGVTRRNGVSPAVNIVSFNSAFVFSAKTTIIIFTPAVQITSSTLLVIKIVIPWHVQI